MEVMRLRALHSSPQKNCVSSHRRFRYKLAPMRLVAAVAALVFTACTAAHAYVLEGPKWAPGSVIVLQLNLGNPSFPLQDGSTSWNQAVAPAIDMWNQNIGRIRVAGVLDSILPARQGDAVCSIVFSNSVYGQSFGSSTLAMTVYHWSSYMSESDTLFNRAQKFDSYRGPLQFPGPGPALVDIRRVFLHELGHGLGLGHPDSSGQHVAAVMNSVVSNQETLTSDDIAGAQAMYGAPLLPPDPTPAPTPIPTPLPTATPAPTASPMPPSGGTPPPTAPASHLANISTRMNVGVRDNVLIGGFIVKGSQPKKVILRAIAPSLVNVAGTLNDPFLELHDASGKGIASNDDWQSGTQVNELIASGVAPTNPKEAAMIVTLAPGSYTAIVTGYNNGGGVALVEVYEFDQNASRLVNISTRGKVGAGEQALIGGLIVQGSTTKNVIVRALGPSLATSTAGALADPTLEVHDSSGNLLATNDNFTSSAQFSQIVATGVPPTDARESAVMLKLTPGNYTAVVRGVNKSTGVGMVEVFDLDP
jgi:hypothetical protein